MKRVIFSTKRFTMTFDHRFGEKALSMDELPKKYQIFKLADFVSFLRPDPFCSQAAAFLSPSQPVFDFPFVQDEMVPQYEAVFANDQSILAGITLGKGS